jgi:hypothetical protein
VLCHAMRGGVHWVASCHEGGGLAVGVPGGGDGRARWHGIPRLGSLHDAGGRKVVCPFECPFGCPFEFPFGQKGMLLKQKGRTIQE